jgi:AcrR family transcriptional regulator
VPKIVNHEERRAEVLEATWRVISAQGVEGATVREIAKEAKVSNGVLAHYFTNKDEIIVQAHRLAYDRVFARASASTAQLHGIETLRRMLYEALPLDEESRVEALIDVSFISRALTNERLRDVRGESMRVARDWWLEALSNAASEGQLTAGIDLELLADEVLVFIDGVSVRAVLYPDSMPPETQRRLADAFLARVAA